MAGLLTSTLEGMDSTQLVLLALLLGVVVGVAASLVVFLSFRARDRARDASSLAIPVGVRDVLHGMDDPAVVIDTSSTVLAASAMAEPFGLVEGEAVASDDLRLVARRAREREDGVQSETLRLRRGALPVEPRLVAVRASRISPRLTLIVIRDITEKERVEQMRRDFVANTSHELKTPVGAVTLRAEAIESAADDPDQVRAFAARLTAEASRLGRLTGRIMNLSRLQAADDLMSDRDVSIDEVVASALDAHAVQAASAEVALTRGGARGLFVRGDVQVLTDAVGNLVANAIAYSPAGSSVGIGVKADGEVVEIAVTDRGVGIPEAEQARIFERFYRADQARSRRTGGTGLGLSIVKHAAQRHGGEVRLWSRPNRGSTFTIRLPQSEPPEYAPPRGKGKGSARSRKPRAMKGETT